jgi:predicted nucleotidyltransferase component of viral defense system
MSLDSFQQRVLEEFFKRQDCFFLTGGGALAGFHLKHRRTKDLDLFTVEEALDQGVATLHEVARSLEASIEALRTAATFKRFLLRRGEDSVMVDLVQDLAPQIYPEKLMIGTIRLDPPEEILANKLCALLSRAELRDLVDIYTLAKRGFSVEHAVSEAAQKDGGMSPGQLSWILSEIELGDDVEPPGGVTLEELRGFLESLREEMAKLAYPT